MAVQARGRVGPGNGCGRKKLEPATAQRSASKLPPKVKKTDISHLTALISHSNGHATDSVLRTHPHASSFQFGYEVFPHSSARDLFLLSATTFSWFRTHPHAKSKTCPDSRTHPHESALSGARRESRPLPPPGTMAPLSNPCAASAPPQRGTPARCGSSCDIAT